MVRGLAFQLGVVPIELGSSLRLKPWPMLFLPEFECCCQYELFDRPRERATNFQSTYIYDGRGSPPVGRIKLEAVRDAACIVSFVSGLPKRYLTALIQTTRDAEPGDTIRIRLGYDELDACGGEIHSRLSRIQF